MVRNMKQLPWYAAAERNKFPILDALRHRVKRGQTMLEIGSGTGQHVVHFAAALPDVRWLPTELPESVSMLRATVEASGLANVELPRVLDVGARWPSLEVEGVFSSNTAHIMNWKEVECMFRGVGRLLRGGRFFLYGPFNRDGRFTSQSNQAFDRSLRERNPEMGLRDDADLVALGRQCALELQEDLEMPSNNRMLVWQSVRTGHEGAGEAPDR